MGRMMPLVRHHFRRLLPPAQRDDNDPDWLARCAGYGDVVQAHPSNAEIRRREALRREWERALYGEPWANPATAYDLATWARRPGEYSRAELDQLLAAIAACLAAL